MKKFLKFLAIVAKNQQGQLGESTDYDMSGYGDDFGLDDDSTDVDTDDNQPEGGQGNGEGELSLENQLESFNPENEESQTGASNLLDMVNGLGAIHNGLPVEVESDDQLRELIMKGFDYTQKTQSLADERSQFQSEVEQERQAIATERESFEQERQEHYEILQANEIFGDILQQLQHTDPDTFNEIQQAFQAQMGIYNRTVNNPVLKKYETKLSDLEKQLAGKNEGELDQRAEQIQKEWSDGLGQVQTNWGAKLKTLGVKPNWQKVQDTWKQSNEMTVQSALLAVYGEQITKALESQKKLANTKAKANQRIQGAARSEQTPEKKSAYRQDDYMNRVMEIAEKY